MVKSSAMIVNGNKSDLAAAPLSVDSIFALWRLHLATDLHDWWWAVSEKMAYYCTNECNDFAIDDT